MGSFKLRSLAVLIPTDTLAGPAARVTSRCRRLPAPTSAAFGSAGRLVSATSYRDHLPLQLSLAGDFRLAVMRAWPLCGNGETTSRALRKVTPPTHEYRDAIWWTAAKRPQVNLVSARFSLEFYKRSDAPIRRLLEFCNGVSRGRRTVGIFLWGGFGVWLALNGVVAARLIRRSTRSDVNSSDAVVLPLRHQT